ncbi:MAG TPA: FAD-dependent oxidoreductase [Gaiellaceae bacterium]|jgi:sarcosine oxidase|nr:FAD-dependent oxidoreductase [Gaiellaceae bacterium]
MQGRAEVAVVGAGIVGLAAADALARAGVDARCFEAAEPGGGQSAGRTRVFRHVHDRADLVELVSRARRGWDEWSELAGSALIGEEGVLFASPDAEAIAELFAAAGVDHRLVDEDEQRRLLPILAPPGGPTLYDVRGGAIRVREAVAALVERLGKRLVLEEVLTVDSDGGVETASGSSRFDRVLICAGARTPRLAAPLGIDLPLEIRDHTRATFRIRKEHACLACWLDRTKAYGATVYSGPIPALEGFAVGLATEDSDPAGSVARVRSYVERALPGLDPDPIETITRPLTILPWHPDAFAVWEAGAVLAFAGHNLFKFAPVLGDLLAEACRGRIAPELRPPNPPTA